METHLAVYYKKNVLAVETILTKICIHNIKDALEQILVMENSIKQKQTQNSFLLKYTLKVVA